MFSSAPPRPHNNSLIVCLQVDSPAWESLSSHYRDGLAATLQQTSDRITKSYCHLFGYGLAMDRNTTEPEWANQNSDRDSIPQRTPGYSLKVSMIPDEDRLKEKIQIELRDTTIGLQPKDDKALLGQLILAAVSLQIRNCCHEHGHNCRVISVDQSAEEVQ